MSCDDHRIQRVDSPYTHVSETHSDYDNSVASHNHYFLKGDTTDTTLDMKKENMAIGDLTDFKPLSKGSTAYVYTASLNMETVVVKLAQANDTGEACPIGCAELATELSILQRISHSNIVRLVGQGSTPQRFIVIEYLQQGTLADALKYREIERQQSKRFYVPEQFPNMITRTRELAGALEYLHSKVAPDISIIHRDIKPDNIGIAGTTFKLIDFGLSVCVKKRSSPNEAYALTGCTGSLRYMAPEVARREAYNEKVDVYSFGILLWQLATCSTPFPGLTRDAFMRDVIHNECRPPMHPTWPEWFIDLLTKCWHPNSSRRPSFQTVCRILAEHGDI